MKIEIITVCDFAKVDKGRLTIIDGRDSFIVPRFPWRLYFGFAIKGLLLHEILDDARYKISIFKLDRDNLSDTNILFETESPRIEEKGKFIIVGNIRGLIFNQPGDYVLRIKASDGAIADCQFKVVTKDDDNE